LIGPSKKKETWEDPKNNNFYVRMECLPLRKLIHNLGNISRIVWEHDGNTRIYIFSSPFPSPPPPPKAHHTYLTLEMLNWNLVGHATGLDLVYSFSYVSKLYVATPKVVRQLNMTVQQK
jgi:hypothetical protein